MFFLLLSSQLDTHAGQTVDKIEKTETSWFSYLPFMGNSEPTPAYLGDSDMDGGTFTSISATTSRLLQNLSTITMVTPLLCCLIVYVFMNSIRRTWAIDKPSVHARRVPTVGHGTPPSFENVDGFHKDMTIPPRHPESKSMKVTGKFGLGLI
mmetsp:Transcript_39000/g.61745  ORF Transcript_39000/g.61745 Transcript_39000/m.61745 type:complete len:152 (-) Transcript_39000:36-491(-)